MEKPTVSLPTPKYIPKDFTEFFIRCYLEATAELDGKPASSVRNNDVVVYHKWTNMCMMVSLVILLKRSGADPGFGCGGTQKILSVFPTPRIGVA